ncbi:leucyl/phenylalanyl-tRNA--protein transferase [Wenzhouxiangella sp. AB-CW3]|uniref:leucyl/phenylalanyl-tRNA--protein transferase n=1 Tax=Wenzhouxiangella sp. AB-CW3 TaxID=2771012 RepID=UPI00168C0BA2|nr:leucyl/phenylalanyl-tRNA--protein transferase [Wenzhouxiangella sp. AB-CW3]QOC21143.1 leucyl/phenylalanyl-tRNA--protein transferase [Wenzhouxiangella sp. AB-CW3]
MTSPIPIPELGSAPDSPFPDPAACMHPEGLLAWGGDLHPTRLLNAYRQGIFPWYELDSPILWWSPEPRAVLFPGHMHLPRRLRRTLRQGRFRAQADTDFDEVIRACAQTRSGQSGTWITPQMEGAYRRLHRFGHAHSIEVFMDDELAGGLYGVAIGRIFFAESKFHRRRDASKIALAVLMRALEHWDYLLADCQLWNPHLERLGVRLLAGEHFREVVAIGVEQESADDAWDPDLEGVNLIDW